MLVIRADQMQVFEDAALRSFENQMLVHLGGFSPPLYKAVGEDQMRQAIRFGIKQAGRYGLTLRGPVRLYLEMMLLFGSRFDTDPQYPWSAEILGSQESVPQMQRADRLYQKTVDYQDKVAGPGDANTLKALREISVLAREPLPFSFERLESGVLTEMTHVYPEKTTFVGEEGLRSLIREGVNEARRHQFTAVRDITLLIVLMFAFGHGCTDDPLYPWIARTLGDGRITGPEARAKRLETKALTWLEHVLAHFDEGVKA